MYCDLVMEIKPLVHYLVKSYSSYSYVEQLVGVARDVTGRRQLLVIVKKNTEVERSPMLRYIDYSTISDHKD